VSSTPGPAARGRPVPQADSGRPALALVFSITVTGILLNTVVNAGVPDILEAFGRPASDAGVLVASGALPGVVVAPLIGVLADRYGRRPVLVPCLVVYGIAGGLAGLAPGFWALVGLRSLQGAGAAGLINLSVVIIGDHWEGEERAKAIGQNAAVLTVSLAVFPGLGGLLTELGGWRLPFALFPLSLVTAVLINRRLFEVDLGPVVGVRQQVRAAATIVRRPVVSGAIVSGFVIFVLIFGLFLTVLPVHLDEEFGLSAGLRGLVLAAPAATSTLAAVNLSRLRARFGRRTLVLGASGLFAVAFVAMGEAPSTLWLVVAALLYGFGEGAVIPTLQDMVASAAPAASRGAVMATFVGVIRAGQATGPLAAGVLIGAAGTSATFMIGGALAAALLVGQLVGSRRL
jgi:MFS transporter, ACDE family, multidrug resistance protein